MLTVEHQELPNFAGRDQASQALILGIEAAHEANLDTFLSKSLLYWAYLIGAPIKSEPNEICLLVTDVAREYKGKNG